MIKNSQKGISLIIAFLIMTIILATVLSFSTILFNKIKILGNIGNSVSSLYAANTGVEKTYYLKKSAGNFCNICAVCTDCSDCTLTPLVPNGCSLADCNNCKLTYNSTFDDRAYKVEATLFPDPLNFDSLNFCVNSKGAYKDTTRTVDQCILVQDLSPPSTATLVINKTAAAEGTFTFTMSGSPSIPPQSITIPSGGGQGSTSTTVSLSASSTYTITETLPLPPPNKVWVVTSTCATPGYGTWNGNNIISNVIMAPGQTTTCNFTNEFTDSPTGTFTLSKNTSGGFGAFSFTGNTGITSLTTTSANNPASQTVTLPVGTYNAQEVVPPGWLLTGSSCTSGAPSSFNITAGQTVTCNFSNNFTP